MQGLEESLLPSAVSSRIRSSWLLELVFGHRIGILLVLYKKRSVTLTTVTAAAEEQGCLRVYIPLDFSQPSQSVLNVN